MFGNGLGFHDLMPSSRLRPIIAADRDWLVESHITSYAQSDGFDESFGKLVADIVDAFLEAHDPDAEHGWILEQDGMRLGSIFCVRLDEFTAQLRLFFLAPEARGKGFGRYLLRSCMDFAENAGYEEMRLWTHESHKAACDLYACNGWVLSDSLPVRSFGQDLVEQTWTYAF